MRTYKVVSPFRIRDGKGNPTSQAANVGDQIELAQADAQRLINAQCITECVAAVEDTTAPPSENRMVKRKRTRRKKDDSDTS